MAVVNIDLVAWWGAIVATLVAVFEFYDKFLRRTMPTTSYSFSTSPSEGNHILLVNGSADALLILHWDLFWARPKWFRLKGDAPILEANQEEPNAIRIDGFSTLKLSFNGTNHFPTYVHDGRQLYIRLWIAGIKRPTVLMVYNSNLEQFGEPFSLIRFIPRFMRPTPNLRRL